MLKAFYSQSIHLRLLAIRLLITMLLLSICRGLFWVINAPLLPETVLLEKIKTLIFGFRFDMSAAIYINLILILGHLLPIPIRSKAAYQKGLLIVFLITNGMALIMELGDIRFFAFGLKRSTVNLMDQTGDLFRLLPQFMKDFWYMIFVFAGMMILGFLLFKKTIPMVRPFKENTLIQLFLLLPALALVVVGARGGVQIRPLMPISAIEMVKDPAMGPLVTNTTLHFVHSLQQRSIEEPGFMSRDSLTKVYPVTHDPGLEDTIMKNENVIIILLESFGKEVSGMFNPGKEGFTPFLDSLMKQGFYFEHSFANGTRSNQAVVSILTSIPSMMPDPFMISKYQGNQIEGLPKLLSDEGYHTAFFHGGNNGTFHFNSFARQSGFSEYYGRSEYGLNDDYDGNWGVFDRPFFSYTVDRINTFQTPFCTMLFSLTSHHPYTVEKEFESSYPKMNPLSRSILYTDTALEEFFKRAENEPWFENTLFVITADHAGRVQDPLYGTAIGFYQVPVLFYKSDGSLKGKTDDVFQHIDIKPTILDYLNYPKPYFAFGRSAFDENHPRYAIQKMGGYGQIIDKEYLLRYSGVKKMFLYQHQTDTMLQINVLSLYPAEARRMNRKLMAAWQLHHHTMIYNKLTVDAWRKWK